MKFNKFYLEPYKDIYRYHKDIQKINKGFRLYFNKKTKEFSVINIFNNYEICNTFKAISDINLNNLRFCCIENIDNIFKSIDENNLKVEIKNKKLQKEIIKYTSSEFVKLSKRTNTISTQDINKIIGVTKC